MSQTVISLLNKTKTNHSWSFSDKTHKDTAYITHGYHRYPAKFMDFCAGIGAGRLGLEKNGLSCVGFSEIDRQAEIKQNDKTNHTQTPNKTEKYTPFFVL